MKILFKNARILTMKDENIILSNLVVKDNRIAYIGNDYNKLAPFDREIECHENLLMPGFKNAHAHSAMVFLRGKADDVPLQEWLFDVVFPHEANLQPTDIYHLNKVAYLEYLTSGITAIFDHYFYPSEMARASEEFGMRSLLLVMPDEEKYPMDYIYDTYHKFNDRKESLVRIRIGFHAEYTSDDACFDRAKTTIEHLKSPFFTHISETEKEVRECVERHHMTPAKYIYEKKWMSVMKDIKRPRLNTCLTKVCLNMVVALITVFISLMKKPKSLKIMAFISLHVHAVTLN